MGQFFIVVNVATRAYVRPVSCTEKMLEHCYQDNECVLAVDTLLREDGLWWKQPFVWTGSYADEEPALMIADEDSSVKNALRPANLYDYAQEHGDRLPSVSRAESSNARCCRYVLNHDKKEFVDISTLPVDAFGNKIHPMCLLVAEGNGRGGGDYKRRSDFNGLLIDYDKVGLWARDRISVQDMEPTDDFAELKVRFLEE